MGRKRLLKRAKSKRKDLNKHKYLIVFLLVCSGLFILAKVLISNSGTTLGVQSFLAKGGDSGGNDSGGSNSGSGSSDSGNSNSGNNDSSGSSNSDSENSRSTTTGGSSFSDSKAKIRSTTPKASITPKVEDENEDVKIEDETETKIDSDETETEIRLSEAERIRTRTRDGRTRIDITSGGIKTRFEFRDDRVVIKAKEEDGTELELEDDSLFEIEDRLAKDDIKIATAGAEKFLLQKGVAGAITTFPISVDLATNTIFVKTPSGQRVVAVLPEQAIQNLIAANVINRLGDQTIIDGVLNSNVSSISQLITLEERNGLPVYEIGGVSDKKLLGFIPVTVERDVTVSAKTGEVVSTNESLANRFIDLFSL